MRQISEKSVIPLEDISSSQVDTESIVRAAVSPSPFDVPEDRGSGERSEENPLGGPECVRWGLVDVADVADEDVDVVGGVDELGLSDYESEGFTVSKTLRRKRIAKKSVSKGVGGNGHLPQCKFSNLQMLPLIFLLEFLFQPVIEPD